MDKIDKMDKVNEIDEVDKSKVNKVKMRQSQLLVAFLLMSKILSII